MGMDAPPLREVIDAVYAELLRRSGKARVGDKTPPYVAIVPQLAILYPEARFIHLIRDGRDVAMSFIDLGFGCRFYDGKRFEWIAAMEFARAWRQTSKPDRFMEVKFEDLVSQPEPTLRRICTFLGANFEAEMLDMPPRVDAVPARERSIHSRLEQPLSPETVGVWRHKLSSIECFCMEACLRDYLLEHRYALRFSAARWQPLLRVAGNALRMSAPLLDRMIPFLQRLRMWNLLSKRIYFFTNSPLGIFSVAISSCGDQRSHSRRSPER